MAFTTIGGSGRLNKRVNIYSNNPTAPPQYDISGATVGSPTPFACNVPAAIEPATATDVLRDGQIISQTQIPITIRYMDGIAPNMTITWQPSAPGGRTLPQMSYIVKGVIHDLDAFGFMVLNCVALGQNY